MKLLQQLDDLCPVDCLVNALNLTIADRLWTREDYYEALLLYISTIECNVDQVLKRCDLFLERPNHACCLMSQVDWNNQSEDRTNLYNVASVMRTE